MTKSFLIATVAAFAITAPAQAADSGQREKREQQAKQKRGNQAAARGKAEVRVERRQNVAKAQVQQKSRVSQPQAKARARVEVERPQVRKQARVERKAAPKVEARKQERVVERKAVQRAPQRAQRERIESQARVQRVEARDNRGQQRRAVVHNRNRERFIAHREQLQRQHRLQRQRQLQQQAQVLQRRDNRLDRRDNLLDRRENRLERRQELIQRQRVLAQTFRRPSRNIGQRINLRQREVNRDWYRAYLARRYSRFAPTNRYFYDYDYNDGYVYKVDRRTGVIAALMPMLGGAFAVRQPMPIGYNSYNVPYAYRSMYYDTPNYQYRYGSGAIYRVNPQTQMIQAVVALLTGQNLGVGEMLPAGYDVYNVPYQYRQRFVDRNDMWYRYADGNVYGVNPYSRRIQSMHPLNYGGYNVGYRAPSYASYGGYTGYGSYGGYPSYSVPYGYQNLYNSQPGYNYQYANGGIYQVDPTTQLVSALVALVTGTNLGVGQTLPSGYDAYNVPSAYRASYYDTPNAWYRYNNGNIYQVDPYSRVVQASIPVSYNGYMVGQPVPAAYSGYAVPTRYSGLYNAAPGYDYRYFDGGIYAVNPQTQIVQSQVALLTGNTFGVGQMLPMGYDAYNVPYAYRDRYFDTPQSMYRYADGYIYQVDPTTRLIQAVIDAIV